MRDIKTVEQGPEGEEMSVSFRKEVRQIPMNSVSHLFDTEERVSAVWAGCSQILPEGRGSDLSRSPVARGRRRHGVLHSRTGSPLWADIH